MSGTLIRLRVKEIRKVAMDYPGMWNDFFSVGKVVHDGEQLLEVERGAFDEINLKYFSKTWRLGTHLHKFLKPVVDRILPGLANCGGCAERELKLNSMGNK